MKKTRILNLIFLMLICVFTSAQRPETYNPKDYSEVGYDSLLYLYNKEFLRRDIKRWRVIEFLSIRSFDGLNTWDQRIEFLKEGISILNDLDSTSLMMKSYNTLGRMYWITGEPEKSIECVYRVAELARVLNDQIWEANAYNNLATSLKSQKQYKNALRLEKKALKIYALKHDSLQQFLTYSNLSESYYNLKMYDSALLVCKQAFTFNNQPEHPTNIYVSAYLKGSLALVLARDQNYDSAKLLIDESAKHLLSYQNFTSDQHSALIEIELAEIFLEERRYNDAILYAQSGFSIGVKNGLNEVIRDGAIVLAQAYEAQNQPTKSIDYYKTYFAYRDSIVNVENVKQIESLRADFEINQKQTELDIVEVRRRNQELVSYITGGVLLILAILAVIVYRNYRQKNALSKKLALINESKNKLFSIISHDLRGPMAAFSGVGFMIKSAMKSDDKSFLEEVAFEVDKSSKQLSSLLDNLLSWSMQEQDGLSVHHEEVDTKQMFQELKETFGSQSKIKNMVIEIEEVEQCMINADRNMTYTIFRNLLSNALKFSPEEGKITVLCQSENDHALITVRDTGVGMTQEKIDALFQFDSKKSTFGTAGEKGLGLGLQLVHEFVEMNSGSIHVESKEGKGTTFKITLPLFAS